jgi:hypothetical protein
LIDHPPTDLVSYTSADEMAAVYRDATAKIRAAIIELGEQSRRLGEAFQSESRYDFGIGLNFRGNREGDCSEKTADDIIARMKLTAWAAIIAKLNIRRLMSSKRIEELDAALEIGSRRHYSSDQPRQQWPDLTTENIRGIAEGYAMSATEFLEEAVREEYDFWRPNRDSHDGHYKRNSEWHLPRRIIRGWIVEGSYRRETPFRCNYSNQAHVTALDSIMHMLDGQGPVKEYKGELVSAIEMSADGKGETKYFKFRCYKNRNLHLEFKRLDLLELFNQIAARGDRLGRRKGAV